MKHPGPPTKAPGWWSTEPPSRPGQRHEGGSFLGAGIDLADPGSSFVPATAGNLVGGLLLGTLIPTVRAKSSPESDRSESDRPSADTQLPVSR